MLKQIGMKMHLIETEVLKVTDNIKIGFLTDEALKCSPTHTLHYLIILYQKFPNIGKDTISI